MAAPDLDGLIRLVTLRQLEIFEAVARYESFTQAAERLYLTQPSVSMQVGKLAETLGAPLFERVGKRIFLTEGGRLLRARSGEIIEALDRLRMDLADMEGLKSGRLRLAVVTTAEYFAPRALGVFCARHPGVEVELLSLNRRQALARVAANADDLYILGQPPEGLDVVAEAFLENPHIPLAHSGHPLAGKKDIPLERLAEEPMIVRERGSGTRKAAEKLFRDAGLSLRIRMELGSTEAIKQAVAGGLGVTILSAHALSLTGLAPLFASLDVRGFPLRRQWRLVQPRGKILSPVAAAFREFLLREGPGLLGPLLPA